MLAGYLAEGGVPLHALTLGVAGDFEVECAAPVARALGAVHDVASVDDSVFPWAADIQANHEHLFGGFANVFMWGSIAALRRLPSTVFTGYLTDSVTAGKTLRSDSHDFDNVFPRLARRAIEPPLLKRLLRRDAFGDVVDETVEHIRAAFHGASPPSPQRAWHFQLAHAERCHVGAIPWRLTFGAWPVIPVLDRRVLDTVGLIPATVVGNRRAQDAILRSRFPRLARIPFVAANGDVIGGLFPSLLSRVLKRFMPRRVRRAHNGASNGQPDRRYNYRMYDFNSPGWRAIRRRAELERARLADLFDMEELAAFVPLPDTTLQVDHGILDFTGRKLVVGLMLWAREHLP
jgi:asparagine synthase (glutamine-hydrolysing)